MSISRKHARSRLTTEQEDGNAQNPDEMQQDQPDGDQEAQEGDGQALQKAGENGDEDNGEDQDYDGENDGDGAQSGFNNNMMLPGGGDMNKMQMMMAMQNGMPSFPMMGKFYEQLKLYLDSTDTTSRHAGNGNGPYGDAKHVYERRVSRHGHERHGQFRKWLWTRCR